jgi:uncharacterized protein (DUF2267 family)
MRYEDFIAQVRDRGEYDSFDEAARVATAVLEVLGDRLSPTEARDLSAQLSGALGEAMANAAGQAAGTYGVDEFCRRVGERTGGQPRTAEWDASAVLSTLAEAVSGGEVNQLLSQLPSGYAPLFGKPELAD